MTVEGAETMQWTILFGGIQLFFTIIIGLYFWHLLRNQQNSKTVVQRESHKEMEQLRRLRAVSLTEPLAEKTRPSRLKKSSDRKTACGHSGQRCAAVIRSMS